MENPARFDLNEAIRQWRMRLQSSPALRTQDLDELESHLRDSAAALETSGLGSRDAFLIAARRLGEPHELECEYGKRNVARIWIDRAFWMLAGLVLFGFTSWIASMVSIAALNRIPLGAASPHWFCFLVAASKWMVIAAVVVLVWRLIDRRHERLYRFARACVARPVIPAIVLVLIGYGHRFLWSWLWFLSAPVSRPDMVSLGAVLGAWQAWSGWVEIIVWFALLMSLARTLTPPRSPIIRGGHVRTFDELELPQRLKANALVAHGITSEEAIHVLTHVEDERRETPSVSADRRIRMERCFWMVAGIVLYQYVLVNVFMLLQKPMLSLAPSWPLTWWPVSRNLFGLISVCVQFGAVAAVVYALLNLGVRYETRVRASRSSIHKTVVLAIGGMLLACSGIALISRIPGALEFRPDPTVPLQTTHLTVFLWSAHGYQFVQNVIFIVLLFWLARRRVTFQEVRCSIASAP